MGGCDLWFHDNSLIPPCINWYQSKYSEHSYDPTVLATRKIHHLDRAHKSSSRDKSCSSNYSKHVHKSRSKDEDKSSSHSRPIHKSRGRYQSKSPCHSYDSTIRRKKKLLCQAHLDIFWVAQDAYHMPSIDLEYPEEHVFPETDKMPTLDHTEVAEDLVPPYPSPVANPPDTTIQGVPPTPPDTATPIPDEDLALIISPPDIMASVPDGDKVLPPGDPALTISPPNIIALVPDDDEVLPTEDPTLNTSPPGFISPVVYDHLSLEEEK